MRIYLDNNATTPLADKVRKEIIKVSAECGNPSSPHSFGNRTRNIVEKSRIKISELLGCHPDRIIFTSGGTEANNLALFGAVASFKGKHIVTSVIEHPTVINSVRHLQHSGFNVSWVDVDKNARVNPDDVLSSLRDGTAMVTIMYANNEVGTIEPLQEIVEGVRNFSDKIVIHTDAVQALGKVDFNIDDLGVDMASFSAHKINGPRGIGALYIRDGINLNSIFKGGHQEKGIRPGTENVVGIAGFARAAELAAGDMRISVRKMQRLKERLKKGLFEKISGLRLNGDWRQALPNTLNVSFPNVESDSLIMMLDMEGIAVSSGSACLSGKEGASHVLKAMGVDPVPAGGSVRFSLSKDNTEKEIDYVIEKTAAAAERISKHSGRVK